MTRRVSYFWKSLESVVGGSAVRAEWSSRLQGNLEWTLAARLLRPNGNLARAYPRGERDASVQAYDVVQHGEEDFVGVCPEGWGTLPLTREQLVVWELDVRRLAEAIGAAMGIAPAFEADVLPFASRLGTYEVAGGSSVPVYLTIGLERSHLTASAQALGALHEPCLLLAPTRELVADDCRMVMRAKRTCFVPLEDALGAEDCGRFVALRTLGQYLSEQRCGPTATLPRPDGCYAPRTIVWRGVEHDCALTKQQMTFVALGLDSRDIDVHRLMNRRSGLLWKRQYVAKQPTRDLISQFVSRLNTALSKAKPAIGISFSLQRDADTVCRSDPAPAPLTSH